MILLTVTLTILTSAMNQNLNNQACLLGRVFVVLLDCLRWQTHPKSGTHFLVAAHRKGPGRRFCFQPLLSLVSSCILLCVSCCMYPVVCILVCNLLWRHSFAAIRNYFFKIPTQTKDKQLSSNHVELQHQIGTIKTSSVMD